MYKHFMASVKTMKLEMAAWTISLWFIINLIILYPIPTVAQQSSNRNVTPGSFIVANSDGTPAWTSPSGEFAFGFKQVAPGLFLLAIWFDQIPEKTVVWSPNRDDPAPSGSRVQLSPQGALELSDQAGRRIWAADYSMARSGTTAHGAMLDAGNFVIVSNASAVLWQSFDTPTDTLLPGQVLNIGGVLVSSFSEKNYSRGGFKLAMQADGNLVIYTRRFPLDDNNTPYWLSETVGAGFQLIFNHTGNIYLVAQNGTMLRNLFGIRSALVGQSPRQRLTLEYDGVFRHYVYENSSKAWSVRDFVPSNICIDLKEEHTGGGACGFNSICSMGGDGRPRCSCPDGYSPRGGRLNGCQPDFLQHRCDQKSDQQSFRLNVMYTTDWPSWDYAAMLNVDEECCRDSCLSDCYCAVAVYYIRNCYKKSFPFPNGREDSSFDGMALVKIRVNTTTAELKPDTDISGSDSHSRKKSSTALITTLSISLGCSLFLSLLLSVLYLRGRRRSMMVGATRVHLAGVNVIRSFDFSELQEATNGFKEELGRGGGATVYKGILKDENGDEKVVAVKKLDRLAKDSDVELRAEVSSISRTNHKNLVQLLGYCDEGQHKILVYEFMSNGSLANFLFQNSSRPNWYTRMQIAFAISRGLCYLHEECSTPIIHCDIKPQNVLLDELYTPKISDFGLAKLMRPDQTRTTTGIRGTRGYVAPEWFRNMPITVKVDVYSYGILLLELVCCRKSYEADAENEGEVVLADWAYDCHQEGVLDALVEGDEEAKSDMKMVERLVMTAIWCIQEDPTLRPHMKRVMHMLDGSIQVPPPPNPTTFMS